jgi:hypothetical protein
LNTGGVSVSGASGLGDGGSANRMLTDHFHLRAGAMHRARSARAGEPG